MDEVPGGPATPILWSEVVLPLSLCRPCKERFMGVSL